MFILGNHLRKLPIISLQNGQIVAVVEGAIINPDNFELAAVYCKNGLWRKRNSVILARDIREVASEGLVINSPDDIEDPAEIIRLKSLIDRNFDPIGTAVITEAGDQLGKVEDYTVDVLSYKIQKLYLKQSLLKHILLNNLVVDRSQIVHVTSKAIVVKNTTITAPSAAPILAPHPLPQD